MGNDVWSTGFQQRLEIIQQQRALSKAEMARMCGMPSRTLENYFKGHKPGVDALLAISRGLGVPVDWLLGDEGWQSEPLARSDLLAEAVWQAAQSYLQDITRDVEAGRIILTLGKIGERDTGQVAAAISANAVQKYRALLSFATKPERRETAKASTTDN